MSLVDTLDFNYIPYIRSGRLTNLAKSSQLFTSLLVKVMDIYLHFAE